MKKYLVRYCVSSMRYGKLIIVKADSIKEAKTKIHDYQINGKEMYEDFEEAVRVSLEGDYFKWLSEENEGEYDWDSVIEAFFRSKKVFGDKRRYKNINLDKVVEECMNNNSNWREVTLETKEAIFSWMNGEVEVFDIDNFKVIE